MDLWDGLERIVANMGEVLSRPYDSAHKHWKYDFIAVFEDLKEVLLLNKDSQRCSICSEISDDLVDGDFCLKCWKSKSA